MLGLLVGGHAEVVSARLNWSHGTIDVRGAGNFLSSVSSQQNLKRQTLKPSVHHSSWTVPVIVLGQISFI